MKRYCFLACCALTAALSLPAFGASTTDQSFLFTATARNFGDYFPSYLANGYFSTMTTVRGVGPAPGYMVALMDHTPGDVSRPAAIPGWSEIDYNAGTGWLNQTRLDPKIFSGYSQTLNMYDGTLTTKYRFKYVRDPTDVAITTFVSEADPHLAATRITLTPRFSGTVRLRFPFRLWSGHEPRFAMAELTGPQMIRAVLASGQDLNDKPVPTPDRAPVWYPGTVVVDRDGADRRALTLWLDGHAVDGASMAEAAAIELPKGLDISRVAVEKDTHELSLNIVADVKEGRRYVFTKFVAASRGGWGGDGKADAALAARARATGFGGLLARSAAAWHRLWKADVLVKGDPAAQRALHSDLYYLIASTTPDTTWSVGACSLTPNYSGHVFWDADSWDFPVLLLLHPRRARSIVMFRDRTMAPARARAAHYGWKGLMYPWESDPQTGVDVTPYSAYDVYREIHVDADIAISQWQYYLATGNKAWLKRYGWPVIRGLAAFWVSRVTYEKADGKYHILHVTSPDEAYSDVNDDSFTNAAARKALQIATRAAAVVGVKPDPQWTEIAAKMDIPFNREANRHYDFDPSTPHDKITWMGSSLIFLMYPDLDLAMSPEVRRNDFNFQLRALKTHGDNPNEMMMVMLTVGAAELGDPATVAYWIDRNLTGFLKPPFNVRTETVTNNAGYLLSSSGGFVQSFLYGLSGLRINDNGLDAEYAPILPTGWTSVTLKDISFRGKQYDVSIRRGADGTARLTRKVL